MDLPADPVDRFNAQIERLARCAELLKAARDAAFSDYVLRSLTAELGHVAHQLALDARAHAQASAARLEEDIWIAELGLPAAAASSTMPRVVEEDIWTPPSPADDPGTTQKPRRGRKAATATKEAGAETSAAADPAPVAGPAPAPDAPSITVASGAAALGALGMTVAEPAAVSASAAAPPTSASPPDATPARRMVGAGRGGLTAAEEQARTHMVSPDAERVLKETGDAFRASEAKRREEADLASPVAEPAAAAAPEPSAPATTPLPTMSPEPEDIVLPFRNGPFQNKKLSDCAVTELEALIANYVNLIPSDPDPESRAKKSSWLERVLAWHRYRLDLFLKDAELDAYRQRRATYQELASAPHPSASLVSHRKSWLDRAEAWGRARGFLAVVSTSGAAAP